MYQITDLRPLGLWHPNSLCDRGQILFKRLKKRGVQSLTIIELLTAVRRSRLWSYQLRDSMALQVLYIVDSYLRFLDGDDAIETFWKRMFGRFAKRSHETYNSLFSPKTRQNFFRRLYRLLRLTEARILEKKGVQCG